MHVRSRPPVAIAHDYLTQRGGAERVVLALARAFPSAQIHTTLYEPDGTFPEFRDLDVVVSPLNRIAALRRDHRAALPFLPNAISRLRVDADVVIASSSGWAHGVPTTGRKLVYCHAPARWLYQTEAYLGAPARTSKRGQILLAMRPWLRRWDHVAATSADRYLANSSVVRERIAETYDIDADVVHPPFGVDGSGPRSPVPELADWPSYYLTVSRLLPYKNVDQVIEAFRGLDERLVIVGYGPLEAQLRGTLPPNVRLLSGLDDAELRWVYSQSEALVAPSLEDFGLTPLEAASFGRPTLALAAGGYLDTVAPGVSGEFFERPVAQHIRSAVIANRGRSWDERVLVAHAEAFSEARFHAQIHDAVAELRGQVTSSR